MDSSESRWNRLAGWIHRSRGAMWIIAAASFLEATVVPIPLELVLVPFLHMRRNQVWRVATVVTVACLVGASLFYLAGSVLLAEWGNRLIEWFGEDGDAEAIRGMIRSQGFWAILLIALTPVPFQLGMLLAGAMGYPFPMFLLAAAIARALRYFGLAWLVRRFGSRAGDLWRRHRLAASGAAAGIVMVLWLIGRVVSSWLVRE